MYALVRADGIAEGEVMSRHWTWSGAAATYAALLQQLQRIPGQEHSSLSWEIVKLTAAAKHSQYVNIHTGACAEEGTSYGQL